MRTLESGNQQLRIYPAGHAYLDYDYEEDDYPPYVCPQKSINHKGYYNSTTRIDLLLSSNKDKAEKILRTTLPNVAPELLEFYFNSIPLEELKS